MNDQGVRLSVLAMACRFELLLEGDDPMRLRAAGEEAIDEIASLDAQLSRFRPTSDVSWINAHAALAPVQVEPRLFQLLLVARDLAAQTDGAFDVTVGPLIKMWRTLDNVEQPLTQTEIQRAASLVGIEHVILDTSSRTVRFDMLGVELDLGAVGKGYAIDRAVECLRESGISRALIHGGTSTVYGLGEWKIGISGRASSILQECDADTKVPPFKALVLRDSALSVSATYGRTFQIGEKACGHVVDPRTGEPVSRTVLAAVWGPSATYCDALSTALLVNGEEWIPELKSRFPGYQGLTISQAEAQFGS